MTNTTLSRGRDRGDADNTAKLNVVRHDERYCDHNYNYTIIFTNYRLKFLIWRNKYMLTEPFIIAFPKVFEAEKTPNGEMKHSCQLLIKKDNKKGLAALEEDVKRATQRGKEKLWGGKVPPFNNLAIRDGDDEVASGKKQPGNGYENHYFINCASKEEDPPEVVVIENKVIKPLLRRSELYSGCIVIADIRAFPFNKAGNKGVAWYLNSILLYDNVNCQRLDGKQKAADAFAKYAEAAEDSQTEVEDKSVFFL